MNQSVDSLLAGLASDIEKKSEEIRAARSERIKSRLFLLMCAAVVLIPALLVLVGVSLTVLILPTAFMSLGVILLLPTLLSGRAAERGEIIYEQI